MEPQLAQITFYLIGAGGIYYPLASLRSASLLATTSTREAYNPNGGHWRHHAAQRNGWRASATGLVLFDAANGMSMDQAWVYLQAQQRARQPLNVDCYSPDATRRRGLALVTVLEMGGRFDNVLQGSIELLGVGPLSVSQACAQAASAGGQGETFNDHDLGYRAGWVRVSYEMFNVPDRMQLIYNGQVVADTGGLVPGQGSLYWYYPADPGQPTTLTIRVYAPNPGTAWNYTFYCPHPNNEP